MEICVSKGASIVVFPKQLQQLKERLQSPLSISGILSLISTVLRRVVKWTSGDCPDQTSAHYGISMKNPWHAAAIRLLHECGWPIPAKVLQQAEEEERRSASERDIDTDTRVKKFLLESLACSSKRNLAALVRAHFGDNNDGAEKRVLRDLDDIFLNTVIETKDTSAQQAIKRFANEIIGEAYADHEDSSKTLQLLRSDLQRRCSVATKIMENYSNQRETK